MKDKNATRAAKAAGYSEKSAHVLGCRLLKDPNVRSQIESSLEKVNAKLDITVERAIRELARLAFFDPRELFNADGTPKAINEMSEDACRAIAGLEVAELYEGSGEGRGLAGYLKKFKLADKEKALEALGKHLMMFPTKPVDVNITDSLADIIQKARKRVSAHLDLSSNGELPCDRSGDPDRRCRLAKCTFRPRLGLLERQFI